MCNVDPANASKILIVGGGLSGAYMALLLAEEGFAVQVHDQRPDPTNHPVGQGRNIHLGLTQKTLDLLHGSGLDEDLIAHSVELQGRVFHRVGRDAEFTP
jgi:2-polyprenyl-6-methoxyphenol hydroxylase-like FAD-dependent oxidoreductase